MPIFLEEAKEIMSPGPDLPMKLLERRTTPIVWVQKQFKPYGDLFWKYHIKEKAYIKEYLHTKKTHVSQWETDITKAL